MPFVKNVRPPGWSPRRGMDGFSTDRCYVHRSVPGGGRRDHRRGRSEGDHRCRQSIREIAIVKVRFENCENFYQEDQK